MGTEAIFVTLTVRANVKQVSAMNDGSLLHGSALGNRSKTYADLSKLPTLRLKIVHGLEHYFPALRKKEIIIFKFFLVLENMPTV